MKKFFKFCLHVLLLLSALLMALLLLCAWKPELTEQIADYLYPGGETKMRVEAQPEAESGEREESAAGEEAFDDAAADRQEAGRETEISAAPGNGDEEQSVYIAPQETDIAAPAEVAGKNGYQAIEGNDSEVEEEEAKALEEQLDVGETGDGLTFDPLYYPYYTMLDENGQHIYRQIYANARALHASFAPVEPVRAQKLRDIISAVYNDHPELFWLDTAYACKHRGNGQCVEIDLQFNRTAENLERENAAFEKAARDMIAEAADFGSAYDQERYVHDMLVHKVDYVRDAEMNQSAYSALVNGRTVCAGYARAFQYLMQQLGVPCYYCTGYAGENHAWDIVKLEDGYYNVDVTWDDTGDGTYDYFNKTDDDYAGTHVRQELSVNLPPCGGGKYRTANLTDEDAGLRSIADAGFSEDDILYTMQDYYDDCYAEILHRGPGSYAFSNILEGGPLFEEWEQAYDGEAYKEAYMIQAMRAVGAKSCYINLTIEKLQQDRYLITHELQLQ